MEGSQPQMVLGRTWPPALALVAALALGCSARAAVVPTAIVEPSEPTQLLSLFGPEHHVVARIDFARIRGTPTEALWSDLLRMPRVYELVLGQLAIEPVRELDAILIVASGLANDDSSMLLRLSGSTAEMRERMLLASNQQLGWTERAGFVNARWPSTSRTARRVIFAAPHELVLAPASSFDRAIEVVRTQRALAPEGELVEPQLAFGPGEIARVWTSDVPSALRVAGVRPTEVDLVVRAVAHHETEFQLVATWQDASEAELARAELARLLGLATTFPLLAGIARALAAFRVERDAATTSIVGRLDPTELEDTLTTARALAELLD